MSDKSKKEKTRKEKTKVHVSFNNLDLLKVKKEKIIGKLDSNTKKETLIRHCQSYRPKDFVPRLLPKKSKIIPSLLILNNNEKEEEENDLLSVKELSFSENNSSSDSSSPSLKNNSNSSIDMNEIDEIDEENNIKTKLDFNENINEDIIEEEEIKEEENKEENKIENSSGKNILLLRQKMHKLKSKALANKAKETGGIIKNDFKLKYSISCNLSKKDIGISSLKDINFIKFASTDKQEKKKPLLIRDVLYNSSKKQLFK